MKATFSFSGDAIVYINDLFFTDQWLQNCDSYRFSFVHQTLHGLVMKLLTITVGQKTSRWQTWFATNFHGFVIWLCFLIQVCFSDLECLNCGQCYICGHCCISRETESSLHITKTRLFKYIENFTSKNRLIDWLSWGLTTRQPLWVILCRLPEKGRKKIEEIVEEMKREGQGRKRNRNESEETEEIKTSPSSLTCYKDSRPCPAVSQCQLGAPMT